MLVPIAAAGVATATRRTASRRAGALLALAGACALVGCAARLADVDLDAAATLASADSASGLFEVKQLGERKHLVFTPADGDPLEAAHLRADLSAWNRVAIAETHAHADGAATVVLVGRTTACGNATMAVHVAPGAAPAWRSAPLGNCRTPPALVWRGEALELRQPQRDDVVLVQLFDPRQGRVAARYEGVEPAAPDPPRAAPGRIAVRTPAPAVAPSPTAAPIIAPAPSPPAAGACPPGLPADADRAVCAIQRSLSGSGLYRTQQGQVKPLPQPAGGPALTPPPPPPSRPRATDPPALPPAPAPAIRRA
jgi:hypothetical protein